MLPKNSNPINVGLVMPLASPRGGAELMLLHLLRASVGQSAVRYHIAFFEDGAIAQEAIALGYSVKIIPVGRLRQPIAFAGAVRALSQWIETDAIHVVMSWMTKAHLYAGIAASLAKVPAIRWQHTYPGRHWMDKVVARIPTRKVLACSRAVADAQAKRDPSRPTQVIYPAVDVSSCHELAQRDQSSIRVGLGVPEDAPIVGIVGRLQQWKGAELLLAACAKLIDRFPDLHVLIVGGEHSLEPGYRQVLQKHAEVLGIGRRTIFTGHQPNSSQWMMAMDVVVNGSRNEPFGMVVIEAMAVGRPVVAVNSGGPAEVVTSGVDGVLIDSDDANLLTAALHTLLSSKELRIRIGCAAAERAKHFDVQRLALETANAVVELSTT